MAPNIGLRGIMGKKKTILGIGSVGGFRLTLLSSV